MFIHSPIEPTTQKPTRIFCFAERRLLVTLQGGEAVLPEFSLAPRELRDRADLPGIGEVSVARNLFLGTLDGSPCRAIELRSPREGEELEVAGSDGDEGSEGLALLGLRSLMGRMDEELLKVAGVASQVLDWDRNHQFCGRCGTPTVASESERARSCPNCSLTAYPRISPAIIVAVLKGDRILLGHNRRHRAGHVFSVLAGFVEPGESLEECVRREVMEEVGIELRDIRYFASQPWPFPDSLMVAFTAAYAGGEIEVDGTEIVEAAWFDKDNLPSIPPHGTVARSLIDWFVESRGNGSGLR